MLGIAARKRGRDRGVGKASIDPIADEREPPYAEMALLELARETRNQPIERLAGSFGVSRGFLEPQRNARWRILRRSSQRLRLPAEHPVECVDHIRAAAESPRQREPGHVEQG